MSGVLIKEAIWTQTQTQTQTCIEGSFCIKTQRNMAVYKPRREAWTGPSLTALRGDRSCRHLDVGFLASIFVRQ